jgi:hypothetical protein
MQVPSTNANRDRALLHDVRIRTQEIKGDIYNLSKGFQLIYLLKPPLRRNINNKNI